MISNVAIISLPITVQEIFDGESHYNTAGTTKRSARPVDMQEVNVMLLGA